MVELVGFEPTAFEAPVECPNHFDQPPTTKKFFFFFFFVLEDDLLYQLFRLGYSTTWDYPQSIMKERKKMGHKSRAYDRGLGIKFGHESRA